MSDVLYRLYAMIMFIIGTIMLTIGLPISGLYWLFTGSFLPYKFWGIGCKILEDNNL